MSEPVFTLCVPADPGYRSIAAEVVARYVDLAGGTEEERRALESAFTKAIDAIADASQADVEVTCVSEPSGFELTLRCDGRSAIVRHSVTRQRE